MKPLAIAYGIICYLIFFVVFLYAVGFTGNILVPKAIDTGQMGSAASAVLIDIVLLMGNYAGTAALLATVDMQLHAGAKPLLPVP